MTPACLWFQMEVSVIVLLNLVVGILYKGATKMDLNPLRILHRRLKFNLSKYVIEWVDVHWQYSLMNTGRVAILVKSALS